MVPSLSIGVGSSVVAVAASAGSHGGGSGDRGIGDSFFPQARGSGVNQTKAALYIYNGYIPIRTAMGKFITAALAIGSGHSLGPEDPSLQIGAGLASVLGVGCGCREIACG